MDKPINCGCGGEAKIRQKYLMGNLPNVYVICGNCAIRTGEYYSKAEAVEAWNRAMGERTAKVEMLLCGNCHESNIFDVVTRQYYKYCLSCGARLRWE